MNPLNTNTVLTLLQLQSYGRFLSQVKCIIHGSFIILQQFMIGILQLLHVLPTTHNISANKSPVVQVKIILIPNSTSKPTYTIITLLQN